MATFGKTDDGASESSWTIDRVCLSSGSPASSGTATKLTARIRIDAAGSCKVKGIIYADTAGAPSALLAESDEVTISNTAEAAVDLPLSGLNQIAVVSGTTYWIGYANEDPGSINFVQSRANTAGQQLRANDTYSDGVANPYSPTGSANGPIDCFVTYSEAGGAVPTSAVYMTTRTKFF